MNLGNLGTGQKSVKKIESPLGQIIGRVKKSCRIFSRTQRFVPISNAGFRAIVVARTEFLYLPALEVPKRELLVARVNC
jgi:hypothetical protein